MGKRIDSGETVAWVEIDGVAYAAEVRERSAELAPPARERGPGLAKARPRALPQPAEMA